MDRPSSASPSSRPSFSPSAAWRCGQLLRIYNHSARAEVVVLLIFVAGQFVLSHAFDLGLPKRWVLARERGVEIAFSVELLEKTRGSIGSVSLTWPNACRTSR